MQARWMAWAFGAAMAFSVLPLRAAEEAKPLTLAQQAALKKLQKDLWDQGYSDAEIKSALEEKTVEFQGHPRPVPSGKEDPRAGRFLRYLQDLEKREILSEDEAARMRRGMMDGLERLDEAPAEERARILERRRREMKGMATERWREKLIRDRVKKGERSPEREIKQFLEQKREECLKAFRDLSGQKLDGEQRMAKLRERFPEVPEILLDLSEEEARASQPSGSDGEKPSEEQDGFSDDEVDEIVEQLMQEFADH